MKKILICLAVISALVGCSDSKKPGAGTSTTPTVGQIKVLFWNIQNGMWSDQGNNYDNFVDWVNSYKPDVCIWCEAETNYKTGSNDRVTGSARTLPSGWGTLAKRYGHNYWAQGGDRDDFSQVITSKYPIETSQQMKGTSDCVISHGAGHFRIKLNGKTLNFVSLHLWPQAYAYGITGAAAQNASKAENGGDKYREKEIKFICEQTIGKATNPDNEYWLMAGDFNARSPKDNDQYKYPLDDTRFLVHNYVLDNTVYKDVIREKHPNTFKTSTSGNGRIDFIYCSPVLMSKVTYADIITSNWNGNKITTDNIGKKHPSDHLPILMYARL